MVVVEDTETDLGLVKTNYPPTASFVHLWPPEALPQQKFISLWALHKKKGLSVFGFWGCCKMGKVAELPGCLRTTSRKRENKVIAILGKLNVVW